MCGGRDGFDEATGKSSIEHTCLVDNENIAGQGVIRIVDKLTGRTVIFEQTVKSAGGCASGFSEALGSASSGRGKEDACLLCLEDIDQ